MENYIIRRATNTNDDKQLNSLLTTVFFPEEVGVLAEVMFNHLPGMSNHYWFIAEEKSTAQMVSAFTLIPWTWEMKGIKLKVAEMGLVGTHEEHRGKGLMKLLNQEFDRTLEEEQFDLAVIQGIPGFYHKFGYHYSLAMENHINVSLHLITNDFNNGEYTFRLAEKEDIPFLMQEDRKYRDANLLSSLRSEEHWGHLMSHGLKTDCASEFWIVNHVSTNESYYLRLLLKGFGTGLIVTEVSEEIPEQAMYSVLNFCKQKAQEREKPYIRLNLHNHSAAAKKVIALGVSESKSYAWQIKIPDKIRLLSTFKPLLEARIMGSEFNNFSGKFRLNLYNETIDMLWCSGHIESITEGSGEECSLTFCISNDLFPSLVLGHHSWEELQSFRPDVSPELHYIVPTEEALSDKTGSLVDALFPKSKSWIYCEY